MTGVVRYLLRLPSDMHATIKAMAERERRSIHAQILTLLEEAIAARKEAEAKIAA